MLVPHSINKVCSYSVGSYGEKSGNCTYMEKCCERDGQKTNITVKANGCKYWNQSCNNDNVYKVCCGAGMLSQRCTCFY